MNTRTLSPVFSYFLMLTLAACASTGEGRSSSAGDANRITREEIEAAHYSDAYALVQALHFSWLQKQGPTSFNNPGQVMVYVDGSRYGGPNSLRRISTQVIDEIRYLGPTEASSRYGFDHQYGAILVFTK